MNDPSKSAQVILDAFTKAWFNLGDPLPAALRALVKQAGSAKHVHVEEILAIVAHLEGKRDS